MLSKNLISKLLLTVAMLGSFSLYCAQAANPKTSANTAAEYFKQFTAAQDAKTAIPGTTSGTLEEELTASKDVLQNFARAYITAQKEAQASGKQDDQYILELLDTLANNDFQSKPIVQALKEEFKNSGYAKLGSDNLFLIKLLSDVNSSTLWSHGLTILQLATQRDQTNLIKLLTALGATK